ncbi:MAG: head-tail connector protein [Alphaproteobacteria bacterium]|nr:head-tail connector protein [Alphaproteobacteria bacterium]
MIECLSTCDGYVITLEHLKNHLRLTESHEDYYLETIIKAATVAVENYLQRTLLQKTLRLTHSGDQGGQMHTIHLLYPPLLSIVSVNEILSNEERRLIKRYMLTPHGSKPYMSVYGGVVEIVYKAGYGEHADCIPFPIRHGVTLLAAEMYDKRVDCVDVLSTTVQFLLQPYRVMSCV